MATSVLRDQMKKMLGVQKFTSDTEVQSVVRQWLGQQPASFFFPIIDYVKNSISTSLIYYAA